MTIEAVSALVTRLGASTLALAALGALLEERIGGTRIDPALRAEIDRLVAELGAHEMLTGVDPSQLKSVVADIRSTLLQGTRIFLTPTSVPGWTLADANTLQAQGDVTARLPHNWSKNIVPRLEGLAARLASKDAAFLDVGVGVAALSITMAQLWPSLHVVGIDPWAPALEIARVNVAQANLAARIELREQAVQDLSDMAVFDLARLPSQFISAPLVRPALERIFRALRPGGWILVGAVNLNPDSFIAAYLRLRNALRGGSSITPAETEALLKEVGYVQVQTLAGGAATARGSLVVGRRI